MMRLMPILAVLVLSMSIEFVVVLVPSAARYVPTKHGAHVAHALWLLSDWNLPASHAMHVRSVTELPCVTTRNPGPHCVLGLQASVLVASCHVSCATMSAWRESNTIKQGEDGSAGGVPRTCGHGVQLRLAAAVSGELWYVPAVQLRHTAQLLELATPVNVPTAHVVQLRSVLVVMAAPMYPPGAHGVSALHCTSLIASCHVAFCGRERQLAGKWCQSSNNKHPLTRMHSVHTRFTNADGVTFCCWPTAHVAHVAQLVWLRAAANEPSAHGVHARSLVTVGAPVMYVPAAHGRTTAHVD